MGYLLDYITDFSGGENTVSAPDQIAQNQVLTAENVDLPLQGGFTKRKGNVVIASGFPATVVRTIEFEYLGSSGRIRKILVLCANGNMYLQTSPTVVAYAWGNGYHCDYEVYRNKCYIIGGGKYIVWDGTTFSTVANGNGDSNLAEVVKCQLIEQRGERIFAAGNPDWPNTLYFSEQADPTYFKTTSSLPAVTDDGDTITAIKEFFEALVVFKTRSIYAWSGWDPTTDVEFNRLAATMGTRSYRSIQYAGSNLLYLGDDGLYALKGTYKNVIVTEKLSTFHTPEFQNIYRSERTRIGDGFTKLENPTTLPTGNGIEADYTFDSKYLAVAHATAPYLSVYRCAEGVLTKLANPTPTPTGTGVAVKWSPDGTFLAVGHATTPFITIYSRSGETLTKLTDPVDLPIGSANGVAWSLDMSYLAVVFLSSPYIRIYARSGNVFTKITDPSTLPTGGGLDCVFSRDMAYLAVAHEVTPFITIYSRSGSTFTKCADPDHLPVGHGQGVSFSYDSLYLAIAHYNNAPTAPHGLTVYKNAGSGDFNYMVPPTGARADNGYSVQFSQDSYYLAVGYGTTPYITIFKQDPTVDPMYGVDPGGPAYTPPEHDYFLYRAMANPTGLPTDHPYYSAFSPDGNYLAVAHVASPYLTSYIRGVPVPHFYNPNHACVHEGKYLLSTVQGTSWLSNLGVVQVTNSDIFLLNLEALVNNLIQFTTYTGWAVTSWLSRSDGILFGGQGTTIRQYQEGYTDGGTAYSVRLKTGTKFQKTPLNMKKYRYAFVWLRQYDQPVDGSTILLTIFIDGRTLDWLAINSTVEQIIDPDESGVWDDEDAIYDASTYDFTDLVTRDVKIRKRGRRILYEFTDSTNNQPLTVYGLGVEYKVKRPKRG